MSNVGKRSEKFAFSSADFLVFGVELEYHAPRL